MTLPRLLTLAMPLLFFPLSGMAEKTAPGSISGSLELGIGAVDNGNGYFGQYGRQLQDEHLFGLGALDLSWRDAEDRFRHGHLQVYAGIDQLGASAALARQGDYRIGLDYRQFESLSWADSSSVYAERGSTQLLPDSYAELSSGERHPAQATMRREEFALALAKEVQRWQFSATANTERKQGRKLTGASERFGDAVLLLAPVDYRHDSVDSGVAYVGDRWAVNSSYYLSRFYNDQRALTFANPINLNAPLRALDMAPDNEFRRFSVDGHYQTTPLSQLSWYLAHGDARQTDDFLQPILVAGQPVLDSLDARRVDTTLRLGFAARATAKLSYKIKGEYRERDNRTQVIQLSPTSYNHLYDNVRKNLDVSASYRLPASLRLKGGMAFSSTERTTLSRDSFADDSDKQRVWAQLRMPVISRLNWSVNIETSERDVKLSPQRLAALSLVAPVQALPEYLLPGRSWQYGVKGDISVSDTVLVMASYERRNDNFSNNYYGLRNRDSNQLDLTLSWQVKKDLAVNIFALYQDTKAPQEGLEYNPTAAPSHANARWRQYLEDDVASLGINLQWQLSASVASKIAYTYSDNDSSYRSTWLENADTGEAAGSEDQLPGWGTASQRLEANADWRYSQRTLIKIGYIYERVTSSDFAWGEDRFSTLGFGWRSPNYDAHALVVAVNYSFDSLK